MGWRLDLAANPHISHSRVSLAAERSEVEESRGPRTVLFAGLPSAVSRLFDCVPLRFAANDVANDMLKMRRLQKS